MSRTSIRKGLITDGERYNKVIDIWADVTERIADELMRELGSEQMVPGIPDQTAEAPAGSPATVHRVSEQP